MRPRLFNPMNPAKILSALTLACTLAISAQAEAPFQASLWPPDNQLVPPTEDVKGVRLQIFGENRNVRAIDIGLAHSTTGDFVGFGGLFTIYNYVGGSTTGVQMGIFNHTKGEVKGWQSGWFNNNTEKLTGLQTGLVNWNNYTSADLSGVQLGFINAAKHVHGVQFGLINFADSLRGVQIGVWNQVDSRAWDGFDPLPKVFPFINIGF